MSTTMHETDDWKLGCFLDWREKTHSETCPECNGTGTVGGGFKDIDGERYCDRCQGRGSITVGAKTPKPEIPAALREHLRRAWWDYFNPPSTDAEAKEPA